MHKLTVVEGEAMTILEAMRETISRGWLNIIFESDSKVVVEASKLILKEYRKNAIPPFISTKRYSFRFYSRKKINNDDIEEEMKDHEEEEEES
ncbi:unnamed protein product [Trifolium pratense]|uniref:Uncharacterized protein n=1 Tax=Trifolium pratense TaxID=57577 RepID=A0ACB0LSZ9_TRIPR|nr:unnamed protein product [Trifolium pratense]